MSDPRICATKKVAALFSGWQGREIRICQSSDVSSEEKLCLDLRAILSCRQLHPAAACETNIIFCRVFSRRAEGEIHRFARLQKG